MPKIKLTEDVAESGFALKDATLAAKMAGARPPRVKVTIRRGKVIEWRKDTELEASEASAAKLIERKVAAPA